jgi:hypothetical protein
MKKEDEPDFYTLDKTNPLPSLEESPLPATTLLPPGMRPSTMGGIPGAVGSMGGMHHPGMGGGYGHGHAGMDNQQQQAMMAMSAAAASGRGGPGGGGMGMGAQGSMAGMPGMNANHQMGMNTLREQQYSQMGMGGGGDAAFATPYGAQSAEYQRLRQLQQMQLFERQMGGGQGMGMTPQQAAMLGRFS